MVSPHRCHAPGCYIVVPARLFMCKRHWFSLPHDLRQAVRKAYVPGQEVRKDPSYAYVLAAHAAKDFIERMEAGLRPVAD